MLCGLFKGWKVKAHGPVLIQGPQGSEPGFCWDARASVCCWEGLQGRAGWKRQVGEFAPQAHPQSCDNRV